MTSGLAAKRFGPMLRAGRWPGWLVSATAVTLLIAAGPFPAAAGEDDAAGRPSAGAAAPDAAAPVRPVGPGGAAGPAALQGGTPSHKPSSAAPLAERPVRTSHLVEPRIAIRPAPGAMQVAVTLDLCDRGFDRRIFDTLVEERIPATLFVTARWIKREPDALTLIKAHPDLFDLQNHGDRHRAAIFGRGGPFGLPVVGDEAGLASEVGGGAEAVAAVASRKPVWFRGAGAFYSPEAIRKIEAMGYRIGGFSLNADAGASLSAAGVRSRLAGAKSGDVIIAHLNHPEREAGAGLAAGLRALKARGASFVLLRDAAPVALPEPAAKSAEPRPVQGRSVAPAAPTPKSADTKPANSRPASPELSDAPPAGRDR